MVLLLYLYQQKRQLTFNKYLHKHNNYTEVSLSFNVKVLNQILQQIRRSWYQNDEKISENPLRVGGKKYFSSQDLRKSINYE